MRSGLICLLLLMSAAHASESGKRVQYQPPEGFAGHQWGDLRSSFDRLPDEPRGVAAAWMRTQQKQSGFHCVPNVSIGQQQSGAQDFCNFQETLLRLRTEFTGGGVYVLSEYAIDGQGFQFGEGDAGVVLHPVIYQFCANWTGNRKKGAPPNFDELNKFCGMRFMFQSESREELRKLPSDHETTYDRVLEKLLAKYGRPKGFLRRGQVLIETLEGDSSDPSDRRFSIWRWCPAVGDGLRTECTASVVLWLDPATGVGTVLYSTPLLWEYAYARQNYGFKGDPLYRVLHARD
jgi:hypothetical protein